MNERSAFAGGDQTYLRDVQYATGEKLDARAHLHRTYSTAPVVLARFEASLVEWSGVRDVLECGCGTGRFWEAHPGPSSMRVTLTDLSPGMVSEATARAAASGFATVRGEACDVQLLPYDDASFDVVVANHMLYHVPDPDRGVAEIARVLRPGGVALVATNGYGHMREVNDAIAEVFGSHEERLYEVFGIDTGESRLREEFGSIVWRAFDNDLLVDDPDAVIAYGLSFPPGESADDAKRQEFGVAVRRRFVDGRLRIRTRSGVFVCTNPRSRSA